MDRASVLEVGCEIVQFISIQLKVCLHPRYVRIALRSVLECRSIVGVHSTHDIGLVEIFESIAQEPNSQEE